MTLTCPHCGYDHEVESYAEETGICCQCGRTVNDCRESDDGGAAPRRSSLMTWGMVLLCGGFLVAVLFPAIYSAQESARRTSASCHGRGIGLALHNYHDQQQHLPMGSIPNDTSPPQLRLSWMVTLLPYLEKHEIHEEFALQHPFNTVTNVSASNCRVYEYHTGLDWGLPPELTDWVGMAGVGVDSPTLPWEDPDAGAFGYDRLITFGSVTDGTSNTIAISESHHNNGPWACCGPSTVRGLDLQSVPPIGEGRQFGREQGSLHVKLDASVLHLSPRNGMQVLSALATIHGNDQAELE